MRLARAFVLVLAVLAAGCSDGGSSGGEAVVAEVGDRAITARSFRLDYELGFAHLKRGADPRRAYLERMIDEQVLAAEGYRRGLDADPGVQRRVARHRERRMVEAVFEEEVNDKVTVSDEEVQRALEEASVRFLLRCFPAPSASAAERVRADVAEEGFDAAVGRRLAAREGGEVTLKDFESGYLNPFEVAPEVLDAVRDLPLETPSAPIPYRGSYLVCEVADVRREAVPLDADGTARAHYREVLRRRKAKTRARSFIREEMAPLDVRLDGSTYGPFRQRLWNWMRAARPEGSLYDALETAEGAEADSLRVLLPEVLFRTKDEEWTVAEFLQQYPAVRYPLTLTRPEAFESDLYDAVGLLLRDRRFIEIARARGLDETPAFQADLERWTDKWVYRAARRQVLDSLGIDAEQHPRAAREAVRSYVEELRSRTKVVIHDAVLDTIDVAVGPERGIPIAVVEGHSGLPAYPVVDPNW